MSNRVDEDCICKGNWRLIVSKCRHLIGRKYRESSTGARFTFFGIVLADDDYYYGMSSKGGLVLLSCVGSIEGHGYELTDEPIHCNRHSCHLVEVEPE